MRRQRSLLFVVAALILTGGFAVAIARSPRFQKWCNPPILALPLDGEVTEMRAGLYGSQALFDSIPEFVVPPDHVPVILGLLRPGKYIQEPWQLDLLNQLGEVVLRSSNGRETRLRFFDAGKNPAVLTLDGENQFYGRGGIVDFGGDPHSVAGGLSLGIAVREAYKASRR
jgi:hypothetical protein